MAGCDQPNYLVYDSGSDELGVFPNSASLQGNRRLIVSNSPETIYDTWNSPPSPPSFGTAFTYDTLYSAGIPIPAGTTPIRLWLWHANGTYADLNVAAFLSLASGNGTASNIKFAQIMNQNYADAGVCLAKNQLAGNFPFTVSNLGLTTTEASLLQITIPDNFLHNYVYGCCLECDITVAQATTLRVRTAASASTSFGSWGDNPKDESQIMRPSGSYQPVHVRGWWPSCKAKMPCPGLEVKPAYPGLRTSIRACEGSGPEHGAGVYAKQPTDTYGTLSGNRGCYGVDLEYTFPITNSSPVTEGYFVSARARNNGGKCFGAAKTTPNLAGGARLGLPLYYAHQSNPITYDYCPLSCYSDGTPSMRNVPAVSNENLSIFVAVGGASATPFNLLVSAGRSLQPPGGGGND